MENIGSQWAKMESNNSTHWEKVYNQYAKNYDSYMENCQYQAPKMGAEIVEKFIPLNSKIIDVACGTGLGGLALKEKGYENIVGIDISDLMLEQARKKNIYIETYRINLEDKLFFADNEFQGVFAMGIMTQIAEGKILAIFREFCRVLTKGSYIIFNHRDDLYEKLGYDKQVQKLVDELVWKKIFISDSQLYLPAHLDYSAKITTRYFVYEVL